MKRILRYLQGMPNYGLLLRYLSGSDLVVYTDADWTGCPDTHCSMSGYAMFLGDNLVFWSAKRQTVVSRSSTEAEYRVVANGVTESTWLQQLLHELQTLPSRCTLIYSASCTSPPTPFSINIPSMWKIDLHFV
jgi:hypothetical protein